MMDSEFETLGEPVDLVDGLVPDMPSAFFWSIRAYKLKHPEEELTGVEVLPGSMVEELYGDIRRLGSSAPEIISMLNFFKDYLTEVTTEKELDVAGFADRVRTVKGAQYIAEFVDNKEFDLSPFMVQEINKFVREAKVFNPEKVQPLFKRLALSITLTSYCIGPNFVISDEFPNKKAAYNSAFEVIELWNKFREIVAKPTNETHNLAEVQTLL